MKKDFLDNLFFKWALKVILGLSILIILYSIVGFLVIPKVAIYFLENKVSNIMSREINVKKISFNPYTFNTKIYQIVVKERNKDNFFSATLINFDFEPIYLLKKQIIFKRFLIKKSNLAIHRYSDGTLNFSDLMIDNETKKDDKEDKLINFSINNIEIIESTIKYDDDKFNTSHIININLGIPLIGNIDKQRDIYVNPYIIGKIDGKSFSLKGKTRPFANDKDTDFVISIKNFDLRKISNYLDIPQKIIIKSGNLSSRFRLNFYVNNQYKLNIYGWAKIEDIALHKDGVDFFETKSIYVNLKYVDLIKLLLELDFKISNVKIFPIDKFRIKNAQLDNHLFFLDNIDISNAILDIRKNKFFFDKITIKDYSLNLKRFNDNTLNITNFVNQLYSNNEIDHDVSNLKKQNKNSAQHIDFYVRTIKFNNGSILFKDLTTSKATNLSLEDLSLEIKDFAYPNREKCYLVASGKLGNFSSLNINGTIYNNYQDIDLIMDINRLDLSKFNVYLANYINGYVSSAVANIGGKVSISIKDDLVLNLVCDIGLSNLVLMENKSNKSILNSDMIKMSKINFTNKPLGIDIDNILFDRLSTYFVKFKDGIYNVSMIIPISNNKNDNKSGKKSNLKINIRKIYISHGNFSYIDKSMEPNLVVKLHNINGFVKNINSYDRSLTEISLNSLLNRNGKLNIQGKLTPFDLKNQIDLVVKLHGAGIKTFSPFIQKYLGYTVKKGKLFYDVILDVEQGKIVAKNKILLDQFELGKSVVSEQATKLPIKFGLAILRDSSGKINLDIPVSGNLDDPNFSYSSVVFKAIIGLFVKIAMSPFSILGALIGTNEPLDYVEFPAGEYFLTKSAENKLNKLGEALKKRPGLKLEVIGYYAKEDDLLAIKDKLFLHMLRMQKINYLNKKRVNHKELQKVDIEKEEYMRFLELAYKNSPFEGKPKNFLGIVKKQPKEFMEEFLKIHIVVTETQLEELAKKRAEEVIRYLTNQSKIDHNRIYYVSDKNLNKKRSMVTFRIKN